MSESATKVTDYFEHVACKYNCGDIKLLLSKEIQACGPLLGSTMNGIDLMGGMMLGFDTGSRKRSIAFMQRYLSLDTLVADVLYSLVRCGISHEGVPKSPVLFFVRYTQTRPTTFFFSGNGAIAVDVTELARRYLDAVELISRNPTQHLRFVPKLSPKEQQLIYDLPFDATANIEELQAALSDGDLMSFGSGGPQLADWLANQPYLSTIFLPGDSAE